MRNSTLLLFFILFAYGTKAQVSCNTSNYIWLVGTWENSKDSSFEKWTYNSRTKNFTGIAYKMNGKDMLIQENMQLLQNKKQCIFRAKTSENKEPVDFIVSESEYALFKAENKEHDFPKYVRYVWNKNGKMEAEIGDDNQRYVFNFSKIAE